MVPKFLSRISQREQHLSSSLHRKIHFTFRVSCIALISALTADRARAVDEYWTGAADDSLWSDTVNWLPASATQWLPNSPANTAPQRSLPQLDNWFFGYLGGASGYRGEKLGGGNLPGTNDTGNTFPTPNPFSPVTTGEIIFPSDPSFTKAPPSFYFLSGDWTVNLNGANPNGNMGLSLGSAQNGTIYTPTVAFENGTLKLGALTLGANGSSGNAIGMGTQDTVTFANTIVSTQSNNAGALTIGSSLGGGNNALRIGTGSVLTNATFGNVTLNTSSSSSGASNNLLVVDGGSLTLKSLTISGFINSSDPNNVIRSNNQFNVANNGQVTATGNVSVGAGNQANITNGGILNVQVSSGTAFSIEAGSNLLVDGAGSALSVANGTTVPANIAGNVTFSNGASGSFGNLGVSGTLAVNNSTVNGALSISGKMDLANGASVSTSGFGLSLQNTGVVNVDGGSQLNTGTFAVSAGKMNVTGGSTFNVSSLNLTSSSDLSGFTVSANSSMNVQSFNLNSNDTKTTMFLTQNGIIKWQGGTITGKGQLHVAAGAALALAGNVNDLGQNSLYVDVGGMLIGGGSLAQNGVSNNGNVHMNGGEINPGLPGDVAGTLLSIHDITLLSSSNRITFDIYGFQNNDQIQLLQGIFGGSGNTLTIALNLWDGIDIPDGDVRAGDSYQLLLGNLNGLNSSGLNVNFDFGTSEDELEENGLTWDTSHFTTDGIVDVIAVPEPSTLALAGVGIGLVAWRMRRRHVQVS